MYYVKLQGIRRIFLFTQTRHAFCCGYKIEFQIVFASRLYRIKWTNQKNTKPSWKWILLSRSIWIFIKIASNWCLFVLIHAWLPTETFPWIIARYQSTEFNWNGWNQLKIRIQNLPDLHSSTRAAIKISTNCAFGALKMKDFLTEIYCPCQLLFIKSIGK